MKDRYVLIADDEPEIIDSLSLVFLKNGFRIATAITGKDAIEVFSKEPSPVVICDNVLPDTNGIELIKKFKSISPHVQVILITGKGTIDTAVSAMKSGAFDFVTKPFKPDHLIQLTLKAGEFYDAVLEKNYLAGQIEKITQQDFIGKHPSIKKLLEVVDAVAKTDSTVLIEGESGTGKELIARLIHKKSLRFNGPFIPVDCGSIPEGLVESELFGHEKGAFTGAVISRPGRFERAKGGTLFLDEIGNLPISSQAKLLRALEDRTIERVGGLRPIEVDIRIIAATNINLLDAVERGAFREDLYYRLNVVKLKLPPLRERKEDILDLAMYFIKKHSKKTHSKASGISKDALSILMDYAWPGNVRELENVIEHALILARSELIMPQDLPELTEKEPLSKLDEMEKEAILKAIKDAGGNKYRAAKILGIQRSTLYSKLKKFGISI